MEELLLWSIQKDRSSGSVHVSHTEDIIRFTNHGDNNNDNNLHVYLFRMEILLSVKDLLN